MNERIKELLEQAGVKFVVMPKDTEYEKFAELIVKECIELCQKEHAHSIHTHAGPWNTAIKRCKDSIARHFGVEQ
jgi:L-lactate utilization protein LutC